MPGSFHSLFLQLLLAFLLIPVFVTAQRGKGSGNGTTVSFGPAIGFYKLNSRHAIGPERRTSFLAGFRREIRVDREYKTFVQFGAEYFIHGVSYRSYFFSQDTLQLYNGSLNYDYELFIQEINVPVQLKILFTRGDNRLHSPYACAAYTLRYLLPGQLQVTEFGNKVKKDFPEMSFRNYLFHEKINAFVSAGLGWQRNKINDKGASFFGEINFKYGFSDYYFHKDYSASSVFVNGTHLVVQLGLKF